MFALLQQTEIYNQTTLHPVGLGALILLGMAVLAVPRKYAVIPFLLMACFVAPAQRVVIASLDFHLLRILVLFGWARLVLRGELQMRWQRLDTLLVAWVTASAIAFMLLHSSSGAITNRLGRMYDFIGMYVYFRCTIRTWRDFDRIVRAFAWISIPVLVFFFVESQTRRNVFSVLGGVPAITAIREGKLRCQGPFPHPILAGCFWSACLSLVAARWWTHPRQRVGTFFFSAAILGIVITTASSTPLMGIGAAFLGVALFPLRRKMRTLRWGIAGCLLGLHLVMKAPVWHLISRIDLVGGSSGYHRYLLIDQTIRRFGEWWLMGTRSTAHWGHYMGDTANQYVAEAVSGGLLGLALFVWTLWAGFRAVGWMRAKVSPRRRIQVLPWSIGVCLFAHALMFIGISISYSHQNLMLLVLVLACIGSLTSATQRMAVQAKRRAAVPATTDEPRMRALPA